MPSILSTARKGSAAVNGGAPYCPNLAELAETGVNYLDTATSKPSDSFPGLMALVSGGSPRTVGAFYDVAYDRSLDPPATTTGNGVAGAPGLCTPGARSDGHDHGIRRGYRYQQAPPERGSTSRRGRRDRVDRSEQARARSGPQLRSRLSLELCSHEHDFWRGARSGRLHRLVGQASFLLVGLGPRQRDERRRLLLAGNQLDPGRRCPPCPAATRCRIRRLYPAAMPGPTASRTSSVTTA